MRNAPAPSSPEFREAVRAYWEDPTTMSIIDPNLHQLEIDTVSRHLRAEDVLADVGCGNGEATVRYARAVRRAVGFERSDRLRSLAIEAGRSSKLTNLSFEAADVLELGGRPGEFDVVVSQRMLINLGSWEEQQRAILNLRRMLKPGGRAILVENTTDAFDALNGLRAEAGLAPIPRHWHNLFFNHEELMRFLEGRFRVLTTHDFGLYYFLTRVYVQMFASFVGFGAAAVKDPVFEHADRAARTAHERFGDRLRVSGHRALGPIQVFVLERHGADE